MSEFDSGVPLPPFEAEHLKTLSDAALVDALKEEVYTVINTRPLEEQASLVTEAQHGWWVPTEEDMIHVHMSDEDATYVTGTDITLEEYVHNAKRRGLVELTRTKDRLQRGLETGQDDGGNTWNAEKTFWKLLEMCVAEEKAGIAMETDFVRQTALDELTEHPGYRAAVLLQIAMNGTAGQSFRLGKEALGEAAELGHINSDEIRRGLTTIIAFIDFAEDLVAVQDMTLGYLGIDLLGRLREMTDLSHDTSSYVVTAAKLVKALRAQALLRQSDDSEV